MAESNIRGVNPTGVMFRGNGIGVISGGYCSDIMITVCTGYE